MMLGQEALNEPLKGLVQEGSVLKSVSVLLNSDVPLEQPAEDTKGCRVILPELLGEVIWEELSDCLIQNCLVNSIPTNSSKLEQYIEVGFQIFPIYIARQAASTESCFADLELRISLS